MKLSEGQFILEGKQLWKFYSALINNIWLCLSCMWPVDKTSWQISTLNCAQLPLCLVRFLR